MITLPHSIATVIPIPETTVKELTERAKINKKTFYRYYDCIDDLLAEKQEMIITNVCKIYRVTKYRMNWIKLFRHSFFSFIRKAVCMRKLYVAALA